MNVLTITNENQIVYTLAQKFFPAGINVIHFKKCADGIIQLNKIKPSVIIVDTDAEPRAWKPLITFIRSGMNDKPIVFLLIMSDCDLETANQALVLGINGIILKPFSLKKSIPKIIQLIRRHIEIEKQRNYYRIKPESEDLILFVYNDIVNRMIVKGQIGNISAIGISINISKSANKMELEKGEVLENCILKVKGYEVRFNLMVLWIQNDVFGGKFVNINPAEFKPLYQYLLEKISFAYQVNQGVKKLSPTESALLEKKANQQLVEIKTEKDLNDSLEEVKDFFD